LADIVNVFEIKVLEKYRNIVPPMAKQEYQDLKESIKKEGQHIPIIVRPDGVILDGHHRHKACQELGIPTKYEIKQFADELLEELFVIDINLFRRHLAPYQRIELVLKKEPLFVEQAEKHQKSGKPLLKFEETPLHVDVELAKEAHVSEGTFYKAKQIIKSGNNIISEEMKENLRADKMSIDYAYQMLRRVEERDKPKPAAPTGQYDVIYIDPPWKYVVPGRGSAENYYATMTDEEIKALHIPAAENCIMFMWVTYPKSKQAFEILDAWGFEHKSEIIWVKDKIGTGYYVRGKHEKLFICIKGKGLGVPAEANRPESVIHAERTEHSKKPDVFYEIIERLYPHRTRIEMFARGKPRAGWKAWGNEVVVVGGDEEKYALSGG
jgi:N6-adenosine-specific RNA methylase IME4/ParB-like chromosome segregation protein Spo0J